MAFTVSPIENLEFAIPTGKDTATITVVLPQVDGMAPADVDKINTELEKMRESGADIPDWKNPNLNSIELMRFTLAYFNRGKAERDAIAKLTPRHLKEIDHVWAKSEIDLGNSGRSTPSSSETVE